MRIIKIISCCMSILFSFSVMAQEIVENTETVPAVTMETTDIKINVDSLQNVIDALTSQLNQLRNNANNLNGEIYSKNQIIDRQKNEIEGLKSKLIFADSIVARVSNDCLRKRFDKTRVEEALTNFSQMYSVELQQKFAPLKKLLSEYEKFNQELVTLFERIQNDKALSNPFTGKNQALSYIEQIKATQYYTEIYSRNWTIPYLNNIIDKVIERIKTYDPKEKKTLQLIELFN